MAYKGARGIGKNLLWFQFPARLQLKIITNDVLGEELFSYHNGNMPLEINELRCPDAANQAIAGGKQSERSVAGTH